VHFVLFTCNIYYEFDNRKIYPFSICNKAQEGSIDGRDYNLYSGDARFDLFTVYLMNLSVTEARERPALALARKKLIRKAVKRVMSFLKQDYVETDSLPTELLNTARSCSRYGVAAARLTSERPGSVTSVSKTFCLEYIL